MMRKKIYEDVLDDIDEIKSDVPEEELDAPFELEDGFSHTFLTIISASYGESGKERVIESLRMNMDIYCDSWKIYVIDKNHGPKFDWLLNEITRVFLSENDTFVIMQFNAGRKETLIRLTLRLFSSNRSLFYLIEHEITGFKVVMNSNGISSYAADLIVRKRILDSRKIHALAFNVDRMILKKWNPDDVS